MTHEHYEELAAGHALDALEPDEEQEFQVHLGTCSRCQEELATHRETLAHLASDVEPVAAPQAVLEALRREALTTGRPLTLPEAPRIDELAQRRARRQMARPPALASAAAALLLVVGLVGWNVSLQRDRDDRTQELASAVSALVNAPGARTATLSKKGSHVAAVAVLEGERVHLVADGLSKNDAATTSYVLWQQDREGQPIALAAFDVDDDLTVLRDIGIRTAPGAAAGFAITLERGNDLPRTPTQPMVASGIVE